MLHDMELLDVGGAYRIDVDVDGCEVRMSTVGTHMFSTMRTQSCALVHAYTYTHEYTIV